MSLRLGMALFIVFAALVAVIFSARPGFWPRVLKAAGKLLATLGRYLFSRCDCPDCGKARGRRYRRGPGPTHPASRVMQARRLDLTDEQARIRWQQISEKQLGAQLRPPQQRDGGQR